MSSENFYDEWVTTNDKKKKNKFNNDEKITFQLSEYSKEGCNYCLQSKCNVHHGEMARNIHPLIKKTIKNPTTIIGDPVKLLSDNGFNFGDKHIHVNTCVWNYTHSHCQNCSEGRFKIIKWTNHKGEDIDLKFCVPVLKENTNVIPIGFHWDIEMSILNNEIVMDDLKVTMYDNIKEKKHSDTKYIERKELPNLSNDSFPNLSNREHSEHIEHIENNNRNNVWTNVEASTVKSNNELIINETRDIHTKDNSTEDNLSNKLEQEIKILMRENSSQKDLIKGLKTAISLDKPFDSDFNKDNISKSQHDIILNENNKLKYDNKKFKDEIFYLKKNDNKRFSEDDKKNIEKATKHFSNILFEAIEQNFYS
jgi:hypothetical protein